MSSAIGLSVVIPVFNECDNLAALDEELRGVLATLKQASEIVYVDDGSTDGSGPLLDTLVSALPEGAIPTFVIHLRRNFGQTAALTAGFDVARGALIAPLDGDGQNAPGDIPRMLTKLDEGYDVVSGWRKRRRDAPLQRRLPSRVANWLIGRFTGLRLHDYGCTLKVYRAHLLKQVRLYGEMHRFIPVFLHRLGARVTEQVVHHRPRESGQSKYGLNRVFKVFLDLFLVVFISRYYARPMHFFGQAALLFLALFGLAGFFMLVFKFGWLSLIGIDYQASFIQTPLPALAGTFLSAAVTSLFFGIMGELLTRIRHEARDVRTYLIAEIRSSDDQR